MIVGIDEAGRGTWAGPLVAAAALVNESFMIPKLTDSKKLTPKNRLTLVNQIRQNAIELGIGWVSAREIDTLGLSKANRLAMARALTQIKLPYDQLLIDGNVEYLPNAQAIIGGDGLEPAISAASIVAKVMRDLYMQRLSLLHPSYGFEKHFGYGTVAHKAAIQEYGILDIHRKSFKPIAQLGLGL